MGTEAQENQYTPKGYRVFAYEVPMRDGACVVVESAISTEGPYVRVIPQHDVGGGIHLDVDSAMLVIDALQSFVAEALMNKLTEAMPR